MDPVDSIIEQHDQNNEWDSDDWVSDDLDKTHKDVWPTLSLSPQSSAGNPTTVPTNQSCTICVNSVTADEYAEFYVRGSCKKCNQHVCQIHSVRKYDHESKAYELCCSGCATLTITQDSGNHQDCQDPGYQKTVHYKTRVKLPVVFQVPVNQGHSQQNEIIPKARRTNTLGSFVPVLPIVRDPNS